MATVIAGMVVITTFLLTSALMFGTFLSTSVSQGESLKVLTDVSNKRLGSALTIHSLSLQVGSPTWQCRWTIAAANRWPGLASST